jgi:hypothetical protein
MGARRRACTESLALEGRVGKLRRGMDMDSHQEYETDDVDLNSVLLGSLKFELIAFLQ